MLIGRSAIVYGGSFLLHAGVALSIVTIEPPTLREATKISIREAKKPEKPKHDAPPPPEQPIIAPREARKLKRAAVTPAPEAAAPSAPSPSAAAAPVADFGLAMAGGVGAGGIAVPLGGGARTQAPRTQRTATPKALNPTSAPRGDAACLDALIKPKPISIPQPAYADRAREAGVEGKVRVELTVDEGGNVVDAKILAGLGYGLDEAALEAARGSRFEPATLCGKATRTTFVIGIRFTL